MDASEKLTQMRVGLFLLLGVVAVAATVVYFGRLGDGIRSYYPVRVEYPNASGLLQGASVLLAGAKVGIVESPPTILPDMNGIYVNLRIYDTVRIPSNAQFRIGSSGLLGDKFVEIVPMDGEAPPIEPDAVIQGTAEGDGFGKLAGSADEVLAEVRKAVESINSIAKKVDAQVLTESTMSDLKQTLDNLQTTSASFAEASGKIEEVISEAREAASQAKIVITKSQTTIEATNASLESIKSAAANFDKTLTELRGLIKQARYGSGPIATLLNDKALSENIREFVRNLRERGILWYRDRPAKED